MKLILLFPALIVFGASPHPKGKQQPPLIIEEKARTVLDDLPLILDDGLTDQKRLTGKEPGKIEEVLATKVRPVAYTGLAVAGMVATFPTPASIGFGIVAVINIYQGWKMNKKKKRRGR
ncbi:MAG: hypothetical protein COB53_08960 [Elusimicrobia bacterium]|nr:MAG: hypothetical protein COB53_08960 [Elusimicrobiota bacterium]